jgi:hypothetical protein
LRTFVVLSSKRADQGFSRLACLCRQPHSHSEFDRLKKLSATKKNWEKCFLFTLYTGGLPSHDLARQIREFFAGPNGRWHSLLKESTSPASVKKTFPRISAALKFSSLSPSSSSGSFCWIPSSSLSAFHFFTSSAVGSVGSDSWGDVPERCPWRLIGRMRRRRNQAKRQGRERQRYYVNARGY